MLLTFCFLWLVTSTTSDWDDAKDTSTHDIKYKRYRSTLPANMPVFVLKVQLKLCVWYDGGGDGGRKALSIPVCFWSGLVACGVGSGGGEGEGDTTLESEKLCMRTGTRMTMTHISYEILWWLSSCLGTGRTQKKLLFFWKKILHESVDTYINICKKYM